MTTPLKIHIKSLPIVINLSRPHIALSCRAANTWYVELSSEGTLLELDALLGADAGGEGMFDFSHLSYEICRFD